MAKFAADGVRVDVPIWVTNLNAFRRWAHSDDFPEEGRICFINGDVLVDLCPEELFSHNQVKQAVNLGLGGFIRQQDLGMYLPDGAMFTNDEAEIASEPDAMVVLNATLATKRIRFSAGEKSGAEATELIGTPDLVVEIVSESSTEKDTEWLMSAYWKAGIAEYWLIDARFDILRFDIYRHRARGFLPTRKSDGWIKSAVLSRSVRLLESLDQHSLPDYTLEIR